MRKILLATIPGAVLSGAILLAPPACADTASVAFNSARVIDPSTVESYFTYSCDPASGVVQYGVVVKDGVTGAIGGTRQNAECDGNSHDVAVPVTKDEGGDYVTGDSASWAFVFVDQDNNGGVPFKGSSVLE